MTRDNTRDLYLNDEYMASYICQNPETCTIQKMKLDVQ